MPTLRHALLSALLVLAACDTGARQPAGDGGANARENGGACTGAPGSEEACPGAVCHPLEMNKQGQKAICTEDCTASGACTRGGTCYSGFAGGKSYCLRDCATNADCLDDFVCVRDADRRYCFVDSAVNADCTVSGQCQSRYIGSDELTRYCGSVTGTTQVCDCPGAKPDPRCTLTPKGDLYIYCCP